MQQMLRRLFVWLLFSIELLFIVEFRLFRTRWYLNNTKMNSFWLLLHFAVSLALRVIVCCAKTDREIIDPPESYSYHNNKTICHWWWLREECILIQCCWKCRFHSLCFFVWAENNNKIRSEQKKRVFGCSAIWLVSVLTNNKSDFHFRHEIKLSGEH